MKSKILTIAFIATLLSITSCTSFKPIATSSDYTTYLKKGDITRIILSDSSQIERFKIEKVSGDTLKGIVITRKSNGPWSYENKALLTSEINSLKKRKFSSGKTLALTGGIILAIYGYSWIYISTHGLDLSF
ncbi:MAG: hypothetical protein U5K54_03100 [Cytophagales bacterium]|nr:hypothetical protein [Cytophagales bacterium]